MGAGSLVGVVTARAFGPCDIDRRTTSCAARDRHLPGQITRSPNAPRAGRLRLERASRQPALVRFSPVYGGQGGDWTGARARGKHSPQDPGTQALRHAGTQALASEDPLLLLFQFFGVLLLLFAERASIALLIRDQQLLKMACRLMRQGHSRCHHNTGKPYACRACRSCSASRDGYLHMRRSSCALSVTHCPGCHGDNTVLHYRKQATPSHVWATPLTAPS